MPRFSDDDNNQNDGPSQSTINVDAKNDKLLLVGSAAASLLEIRQSEDTEPRVLLGVKCEGKERTIIDVDQIKPITDASEGTIMGRLDESLTINEDTNEVRNVAASIDDDDIIVISDPNADTAYRITEVDGQYSIANRLSVVISQSDDTDVEPPSENTTETDGQMSAEDTTQDDSDDVATQEGHNEDQPTVETAPTGHQEPQAEQRADDQETRVDINKEITALSTMFSSISRDDFYRLDNGNIGTEVSVIPSSNAVEQIDLVIEYTDDFPKYPPRVWVLDPNISSDHDTVIEVDQRGDARIQFIDANTWAQYRDTRVALDHLRDWIIRFCKQQENISAGDVVRETTEYVADRGQDFIQDVRNRRGNDGDDDGESR